MKYPNITLGHIEALWDRLGGEEGVQRLLSGDSSIVENRHCIDLDAPPSVQPGWEAVEHHMFDAVGSRRFKLSVGSITLHLDDAQLGGKCIDGYRLHAQLRHLPVLNANVLDYLLTHQHLIPDSWCRTVHGETQYVLFWGTIYRDAQDDRYVRHLSRSHGVWESGCRWLDSNFCSNSPAALCTLAPAASV